MVGIQIVHAAMSHQEPSSNIKLNLNSDGTTVDVASIYNPIRTLPENVMFVPPTAFRRRLLRHSFSGS
jgi:hypothetical protein